MNLEAVILNDSEKEQMPDDLTPMWHIKKQRRAGETESVRLKVSTLYVVDPGLNPGTIVPSTTGAKLEAQSWEEPAPPRASQEPKPLPPQKKNTKKQTKNPRKSGEYLGLLTTELKRPWWEEENRVQEGWADNDKK